MFSYLPRRKPHHLYSNLEIEFGVRKFKISELNYSELSY
jgi:hypothetical protein